ncbi:MAG TPA: glycosyltransferase family 9 protein [Gemmatimonadaceae bacterium]|nr:glycosyltransferase family 9 protein [Gemmatimonadaceae bacterium]
MTRSQPTTSFLPESFRKRHNLLLGRASEAVRPLLKMAGSAAARGRVRSPNEWRRGLIIGHNHMGDVLYRTGSLPVLSEALPQCRWSFLTSPDSAKVLANNPHVAEVIPYQNEDDSWSMSFDQIRELRARRFDAVLCSNSLRYYPDLFLSVRLGIPNRVSFVHKGMSGLATHPVPIEFPSPYAAYFRSIVSAVTGKSADWSLRPQVFPDVESVQQADAVYEEISGGLPVVACVLTTRQAHGNWPAKYLIEILREARKQRAFTVAFCGAPGDAQVLSELTASYQHEKSIAAGRLPLLSFAAFLGRSAALLTLDSGPRHLGNAMSVPVIFARNMSHSRVEAGAYCQTETDIAPGGEYLNDQEIEIAAAATPITRAVNKLIEIIPRESRA